MLGPRTLVVIVFISLGMITLCTLVGYFPNFLSIVVGVIVGVLLWVADKKSVLASFVNSKT